MAVELCIRKNLVLLIYWGQNGIKMQKRLWKIGAAIEPLYKNTTESNYWIVKSSAEFKDQCV